MVDAPRMTRDELRDALGGLYSRTDMDWTLTVRQSLTEPTGACATVHPDEHPEFAGFAAWGDTPEEAITTAMALAHQRMIVGDENTPNLKPWTNPGECDLPAMWLARGDAAREHV